MTLWTQRAKRFEIAAQVEFMWLPTEGVVQAGTGFTRNIANSGVLIAASECPAAGSPIQMTVFLSRIEGHGMNLHGEGVVVRVETETMPPDLRPTGFAASVQFYPEPMDTSVQPEQAGTGNTIDTAFFRALYSARKNCS